MPVQKPMTAKEQREKEHQEKLQVDKYYEMKIEENNIDEDICCDICLEKEYEDDDMIVICELCNVAVHQMCYGGDIKDKVPSGDWYCDRCKVLKANQSMACNDIECFLCNDIKGAMKCIDEQQNTWAHVICVNWTPGIYFTDENKNKIEGKLELERFNLTCHQCMER
jgi:hypothetical protein